MPIVCFSLPIDLYSVVLPKFSKNFETNFHDSGHKISALYFCTWKPLTGQVVDVPVNFDLQRRNKVRDKIEQHTIAKLPSSPDSCFGTYLDCMNLTHRY